ncbi:pks3 [Symbiodinium sp. CCMP2592]|nr:pks3 [Symbiodinium sp. CCMP2592]
MEQLSRNYQDLFQLFPADVRKGYLESAVTQAIQQASWTVVADFLQAENLGSLYEPQKALEIAQATLESLIGQVLDKHEAAGGDGMVEAAAAELSEALSVVCRLGMFESIREPIHAVKLVVSVSDESQIMEMQQALTAVLGGIDTPVLRAAHHGIGERLQKRCQDKVAQLTAQSDAAEALRSAERFFKEVSEEEVLVLYLAKEDISAPPETVAKFKQILSEINDASNRLAEALKVAGAGTKTAAVEVFETFVATLCSRAVEGLTLQFSKVIPTFGNDSTVDICVATFLNSMSSHRDVMTMLAGDGVQKLLDEIKATVVNEVDPQVTNVLAKSNTLQQLVQLVSSTLQLMAQTGGGGKSFRVWQRELSNSIPAWDRKSFCSCLETFCNACAKVDEPFHANIAALEVDGAEDFLALLLTTVDKSLPELWQNAKVEFQVKLIQSAEAFASYQSRFLPSPQRVNKDLWQKLAELPGPNHEYQVLTKMSPILKISADVMQRLQQDFEYNSLRSCVVEFIHLQLSNDEPDLQLLCASADKATQKLKESGRHQEKELLDFFSEYMLGPIFVVMEKTLCAILEEAVKAIPNQFEKLIENRNIVAIKTTLFQKATHIKASGLLQDLPWIWRFFKTVISFSSSL